MHTVKATAAAVPLLLLAALATAPAAAQAPTMIKGEAILAHPAGKLAIRAAELLAAGKIDDVIRLRTAADQAELKKESAAERADWAQRAKDRAPDPKLLAAAIRKGGVLTVFPDRASLESPYADGGEVMAMFTLEAGKWYASLGPMVMAGAPAPGTEVRIEGEEILKHPIYALALEYADAVHSGKPEALLKLYSTKKQADWKAESESERKEIAAYYKKTIPKRTDLAAGVRSGGVLFIENDNVATLNVITIESKSKEPGVVQSTSTTVGILFVLEGGQWRVK